MWLTLVENFKPVYQFIIENILFILFATSAFLALVCISILYQMLRRRPFLRSKKRVLVTQKVAQSQENLESQPAAEPEDQQEHTEPAPVIRFVSSIDDELNDFKFVNAELGAEGSWNIDAVSKFREDVLQDKVNQMTVPSLICFLKACSKDQRKQIFSKIKLQTSIKRMFE
jgi:hypothetical protein